jgi:hypothetical protein
MSLAKVTEMENPSWYLYGPGAAKIQDRPKPTIRNDHDVVVRIRYVGVCGSDVGRKINFPLSFRHLSVILQDKYLPNRG